ncbi:MAG: serine protease [archaeon]|nr:serine protease [archaeon]
MFTLACERISKFTRPLTVLTRTVDGTVGSETGTYFFVNNEGYAVTAAHIFDSHSRYLNDRAKIKECEENPSIPKDPSWITDISFFFGINGVSLSSLYLDRQLDLAVMKIDGVRPEDLTVLPVFRQADTLRSGMSICRTGFPFSEVSPSFDTASRTFDIGEARYNLLPLDGILTRTVDRGSSRLEHRMLYIEGSTPSIKGHSGGPVFDTEGMVCGMTTENQSLNMGLKFPFSPDDDLIMSPFVHLGLGVHVRSLVDVLTERGVCITVSDKG